MSHYTVLHSHCTLQLTAGRLVVPSSELSDFLSAVQCAQALSTALAQEKKRIRTAACAAEKMGFDHGLQQGKVAATQAFTKAAEKMANDLKDQQEAARACLSALAVAVVYKISNTLGASQVVPALIAQAVQELLPLQASRIRVNPHVAQAACVQVPGVEIRGDESLGAFDCVIDTVQGHNVVSLDAQLASICAALGVAPPVHCAANQDREIA
jgi:flagellar biosynthesis/type III secretory pathway protein FliH